MTATRTPPADRVSVPITVSDQSGVAEARRRAVDLAKTAGFAGPALEKVAIATTEAASNLTRHATGGMILLRAMADPEPPGVEVLSLDRGPGIRNLGESLRDGYSTVGGQGTGLGAIRRLADAFDIYSQTGRGTALVARFRSGARPAGGGAGPPEPAIGAVCVAVPGEQECGDGWTAVGLPRGGLVVAVIDGLGHGPEAALAARTAERIVSGHPSAHTAETLERLHPALATTRGVAVAVAGMDPTRGILRYSGVGNIRGHLIGGGDSRALVSHNGIVGHNMRKVTENTYPLPAKAVLVMASDGLTTRWSLDDYPGLAVRHPSLIAGCLFRDAARGSDDAACVAVRLAGTAPDERGLAS